MDIRPSERLKRMNRIFAFFKKETVLCVSLILAAASMFFVPPDKEYWGYIDFRTLAILFCLMSVMAGLQKIGVFGQIAEGLLRHVRSGRGLILTLVLLCFFSGMLITNDVALITFVPFTFIVLRMLGGEQKDRLALPVVVMQTIAANLGSMLTPVGNPQNLYLYGKAGLSVGGFIVLMLPYTLLSLVLLVGWSLIQGRACPQIPKSHDSAPAEEEPSEVPSKRPSEQLTGEGLSGEEPSEARSKQPSEQLTGEGLSGEELSEARSKQPSEQLTGEGLSGEEPAEAQSKQPADELAEEEPAGKEIPHGKGVLYPFLVYLALFLLCLLAVGRILPWQAALLAVGVMVFLTDRQVFKGVDYSLLLTFTGFFVFVGNVGRIPVFRDFLQGIIAGREVYTAILVSQVISNVPAALLLSGFTEDFAGLIIGTNLGGLGTLIASMASLISYKYVAKEINSRKGRYILLFTVGNLLFLAILVLAHAVL